MTIQFRDLAARAVADGEIDADEVLALRRVAWPDGMIDAIEAEALFTINRRLASPSAEWTDFFVEALVSYCVTQGRVRGYVEQPTADWLVTRLDADGVLESMAELEALVRILETALSTPQSLRDYALAAIERAVLTGSGPTRKGGDLDPGCISAAECALLRRVIFAGGGDGPGRVSEAEADLLFRLKDATLGQPNAPEWETLFVQGVANFLEAWHGTEVPDEARAAELERFMADTSAGVGRFLGRMARTDAAAFRNGLGVVFGRKGAARDHAAEVREARAIDAGEDAWLSAHIEADGQVDPLERALLTFIAKG